MESLGGVEVAAKQKREAVPARKDFPVGERKRAFLTVFQIAAGALKPPSFAKSAARHKYQAAVVR